MSKPPTFPQRVRAAVKGWLDGSYTQSPWYLGDTSSGTGILYRAPGIDYRAEAGPADANAIVMACINWVVTTFPEAPIRVQRTTGAQTATVDDHALTTLVNTPNPYYTGLDLWAATLADYNIGGNAYWIAARNGDGRPVELWYEPSFSIRCVGTAQDFIAYWEIYRDGAWVRLKKRENLVVQFRRGIDPRNPRYGLSPLLAAYRELYTDQAAADWSATLLRNTGIPGVIIAPKGNDEITEPGQVKQDYMNKFTGERRGEPLVMTRPTDVYKLDWSPAEMDLTAIRRMPEERISALLGVPAIVAGLGAGLDRSTYSNFEEARAQGWYDNISPTQMRMAATLQHRLLPLLGTPATERVSFDTKQVKALQDDANALYTRMATGYDSGFVKRSEARTATGWAPADDGSDDVYKAASPAPPQLPAPDTTKARGMSELEWDRMLATFGGTVDLADFAREDLLPGERKALEAALARRLRLLKATLLDINGTQYESEIQAVLDGIYQQALATPATRRKAAPPPDATERRFRRDVQGVLDTVYREALAEVPDGKALAGRSNGHTEG